MEEDEEEFREGSKRNSSTTIGDGLAHLEKGEVNDSADGPANHRNGFRSTSL